MRSNALATSPSIVGHDAVEELHHRDLGAEPPPHAAELQPDIAAADHHEMAGHRSSSSPPVEVTICFSSTSTPGSGTLSLPVAMTMCFAS